MVTTEGKKYRYFHNGDFSGDMQVADKKTGETIFEIPFADMKRVVAQYIKDIKIAKLEDSADDEILGI